MKKLVLSTVAALLAVSTGVFAGGQTMEPVAPAYGWTGFYVGADAGYMWGNASVLDVNSYNAVGANGVAALSPNPYSYSPDGGIFAGHLGYQMLLGSMFLVGVEGQGGWMGLSGSSQYAPYVGLGTRTNDSIASTNSGGFGAIAGRLGFVFAENFLVYGKGGYAWTSVDNTFIDTNPTGISLSATTRADHDGWLAGAGLEYAIDPNWSVRAEYDHYDFGNGTTTGLGSNGTTYSFRHTLTANALQLGFSYLFNFA